MHGCRTSWKYSNEQLSLVHVITSSIHKIRRTLVSGPANSDLVSFSVSHRDENDNLTVST